MELTMTPTELNTYVRQQYNAVNDTFFTDSEIFNYALEAETELARHAYVIKSTYTDTSVASQQEYAYPTNALAVYRVTYAGRKLRPITFREDDQVTLLNAATTATGEPLYYAKWDDVLHLRPVPASSGDTIKVYTYDIPASITASGSLNVPARYHLSLANFCISKMATKDKNLQLAQYYHNLWVDTLKQARSEEVRAWNADGFTGSQGVVGYEDTILGFS
jgi:hypothetical protein